MTRIRNPATQKNASIKKNFFANDEITLFLQLQTTIILSNNYAKFP